MATKAEVTPNRRGLRSRELVLDAAERVMAEHGYDGASVARVVEEAGIPISSVYHYFGSKDGVLLAVMERGSERFFEALPDRPKELVGTPVEHLRLVVSTTAAVLSEHPDFLRLLVVIAAQPPQAGDGQVREVIARVRERARAEIRAQLAVVFGIKPAGKEAKALARFTLATFDGAFVAQQAEPKDRLADIVAGLPEAIAAMHDGFIA